MGTEVGKSIDSVMDELAADARQFNFFQLVHLLERGSGGAPIGYSGPVGQELIRFRALPSLACPPSDISGFRRVRSSADGPLRFELTTTFLGLFGPASPLPAHYTEAVIAADLDTTNRRDFLDFFHQRLHSLLYRAWSKYRYFINFRRDAEDAFSQRVLALVGAQSRALRNASGLDWGRMLSCVGLVAMKGMSGDALERIISRYFDGTRIRVQPFVSRWVAIEHDQITRLGSANSALGHDAVVGRRVRDCSGKFRLEFEALGWQRFNDFLPVADDYRRLIKLVKFLLQDDLAFDLVLKIKRADCVPLQLERGNPCRLGWTSWLGKPTDDTPSVRLSCVG